MKRKLALWLVCLTVALAMTGCATVNEGNSFQSNAPGEVAVTGETQPTEDAQPTALPAEATAAPAATDAPTPTPLAPGYNG